MTPDKINVLIVDDETELVRAFKKKLDGEGFSVSVALRARDVSPLLEKQAFDVAVLDIKLPDMDGVDLLKALKEAEPSLEIIMLTGHASIDTAINSMRIGAYDYLTKPCKLSELTNVLLKAYEKKALREKNLLLESRLDRTRVDGTLVGGSLPMQEMKQLISVVGNSAVPVLVTGETGTGKELVARAIHASSSRSRGSFVAINSSTLQESILESELFGYKRGAFTGAKIDKAGLLEMAHNGTFFVDEIGDMGLAIQAKLLRVLETGAFIKLGDVRETRVDVRFIFATNKRLEEEIEAKSFRKDLFYRINAFTIPTPPLRARTDDISLLADHFLSRLARGGRRKRIPYQTIKVLQQYQWPGNVRELANVLERAVLISGEREELIIDDLPLTVRVVSAGDVHGPEARIPEAGLRLDAMEKAHVARVLRETGGNKKRAAELLGISRKKLYQVIGKLQSGLSEP